MTLLGAYEFHIKRSMPFKFSARWL